MKFKKIFLLIPVVLILVLFVIFKIKDGFTKVKAFTITYETLTNSVSASGKISSDEKASLSFPLGGTIKKVEVKEGDLVTKDQTLVTADTSKEYNNYLALKASYDQAQINLELFKQQYQDDPTTSAIGSDDIYWQKYKSLEESINYAKSAMNASLSSLSEKYLKAPFNGVVIKINYKENEFVAPGTPVVEIYNPQSTFFTAQFDEEDFGYLKVNLPAKINLDSFPNEEFDGTIFELPKSLSKDSSNTNVFEVKIKLPESLVLKAVLEMKGDASVILYSQENTLILDDSAIIEENGNKFVYKIDNGKTVKTLVETGKSGDQGVEILNGLLEGDKVIISDTSKIKNHQKVKYE